MKKEIQENFETEKKVRHPLSRELLYYFTISVIIVVMFLSFLIGIAVFTPKNIVIAIWYWDNGNYAIYRSPVEGKYLYSYIERTTVSGYEFKGYYFTNKSDEDNDGVYTFNENDKIPENYKMEKDIVVYARWDRV